MTEQEITRSIRAHQKRLNEIKRELPRSMNRLALVREKNWLDGMIDTLRRMEPCPVVRGHLRLVGPATVAEDVQARANRVMSQSITYGKGR